ncbi:hypothetical protein V1282_003514 [Nitrobacteraceae bacterium AZCC 2146]
MTIKYPSISDVSPLFHELHVRRSALADRRAAIEAEARGLASIQRTGEDPYRQQRVDALVKGEVIAQPANTDMRLQAVLSELADTIEADRVLERQIQDARSKGARAICETIKPDHDRIMKTLTKSLSEAHRASVELHDLRRSMVDDGIATGPLFNVMPDFLGYPRDKTSDCAEFFRDAAKSGYCSLAKELA